MSRLILMALIGFLFGKVILDSQPFALCRSYCASRGQDNVEMLRDSYGGCRCDNEEGRVMDRAYLKEINPTFLKCNGAK